MTNINNPFEKALADARAKGKKPDKWVVSGHVASALIKNRRNHQGQFIDLVNVQETSFEILGLPVRKSYKIEPMSVILAEGKKGLTGFSIPMVLDLTELEVSA